MYTLIYERTLNEELFALRIILVLEMMNTSGLDFYDICNKIG